MLKGGEVGSGDETIAKKSSLFRLQRTTKRLSVFLRVTPSVAAPGDTNLISDALVADAALSYSRHTVIAGYVKK